jgi:predicted permease
MYVIFVRILAVFLMVALGVLARRFRVVDSTMTTQLAHLTTKFFYPALIYATIVRGFTLETLVQNLPLPGGALGIMLLGFVLGQIAVRMVHLDSEPRRRVFQFQCTISNYSFLPMPLCYMFWGEKGVALLLFSTVGSELAVWTFGVWGLTGGRLNRQSLRHLVNAPMCTILLAAATLTILHFIPPPLISPQAPETVGAGRELWNSVLEALRLFGGATIPCSMVIVGSRMSQLQFGGLIDRAQVVLVTLRLVLVPAVALLVLHRIPLDDSVRQVLSVVAVMPTSFASILLSDLYDADSEFAAVGVLLTHLCCLVTIPLWFAVVQVH